MDKAVVEEVYRQTLAELAATFFDRYMTEPDREAALRDFRNGLQLAREAQDVLLKECS